MVSAHQAGLVVPSIGQGVASLPGVLESPCVALE